MGLIKHKHVAADLDDGFSKNGSIDARGLRSNLCDKSS